MRRRSETASHRGGTASLELDDDVDDDDDDEIVTASRRRG